jgi:ribonuclease Z
MGTLHLLGTGSSVTDAHRTTTMLAVESAGSFVVVDCGGDAVQRLLAAGLTPSRVEALIVTHEHADHVGGLPLFMQKTWLHGRRKAVPVHGIPPALDQARRIHDAFRRDGWKGYPGVEWREFAHVENALVLASDTWEITASPGVHSVPTAGLRILERITGACVVYSSDTEFSTSIARLASGAALLVHEATGAGEGHSSAIEAARVAAEASARRLLLTHLPEARELGGELLRQARAVFPATEIAIEGGRYLF